MRKTPVVLGVVALLAAGCASSRRVLIVERGLYAPTAPAGEEAAPGTAVGSVHVVDPFVGPTLERSTRAIVAKVGDHFGFRMIAPHGRVRSIVKYVIRVHHPPFTHPETGKTSTVEEWDAEVNMGLARFVGWRFDAPWELVPGEWVFEVLRRGEVVARVPFQIVVAAEP